MTQPESIARFTTLTSRPVILARENIDTDQIIPARFLTTTTREGLGRHLFHDWRYDRTGAVRPDSVLDDPGQQGRSILVGGRNFGCGSSREHAPWALADFGFRAVVSTQIADIFRNNAAKNGIVPVEVDEVFHSLILANPDAPLTVNLEACTISLADLGSRRFDIDSFARHCLLEGVDRLGFLLSKSAEIAAHERNQPC